MTSLSSQTQTNQRVSHPFITGQVYREQRPEAVEKIHGRIRQAYRGANKQCIRLPIRIYLRVLAITTNSVVVISTEDPTPRECFYNLEQGANFVATGAWLLSDIEPLAIMRVPDHQLSKNQTAVMDKNTALIQPLIDLDEDVLIPQIRWPVVRAIALKRQIEPAYVLRVLGRYLQGGMSPQALAGRWFRRLSRIGLGARVNMASEKSVRRHPAGRPRLDGKSAYIVQEIDVKKIIAGARKHYFAGDTFGVWRRAWKLTVARDYLDLDCENGIPSNEQLARFSPGDYPSYKQFRYWAKFDEDYEMLLRKLYGDRKFQRKEPLKN